MQYLNAYVVKPLLNLLYPTRCIVCEHHSEMTDFLCRDCFQQLSLFNSTPFSIQNDPIPEIESVYSLFRFNHIFKILIHHLKYRNMPYIGYFLGQKMGLFFKHQGFSDYDAVLPIPLHPVKLRERGYNQSYEIALGLSEGLGIPCDNKSLKRIKYTQTQTALSKEERNKNMENVFSFSLKNTNYASFILIDDVFTTGATVTAAAKSIKSQGNYTISVLTAGTPFYLKHCLLTDGLDDTFQINNK